MPSTVKTIQIKHWKEYKELVLSDSFRSWAFRGQADGSWPMYSSLSRYFREFHVDPRAWTTQEHRILRVFKRKAHLYLQHVPDEKDDFQWLALMQHHGTPTRLIDFTWSPLVAAFFALFRTTHSAAAVWAVFPPLIDHSKTQRIRGGKIINARKHWLRTTGNFEKYFLPGKKPFAVIGEPDIMNQRLIAQSGTFVVPGKIDEPLESILTDYENSDKLIVKFVLRTDSVRREAMKDLYDSNINEATLFPGIDGMARSLAFELEYHWAYDPVSFKLVPGFENPPFELPPGIH